MRRALIATGDAIRHPRAGRLRVTDVKGGRPRVIDADNFKVVDAAETGALGVQDYVLCCAKGNQLPSALDALDPLVGDATCCVFVQVRSPPLPASCSCAPESSDLSPCALHHQGTWRDTGWLGTIGGGAARSSQKQCVHTRRPTELLPAQNGLPFFHNALSSHPELAGAQLASVDPGGALLQRLDPHRVPVAVCVTHIAVARTAPNEVLCTSPQEITRFTMGGVRGGASEQPLPSLVELMLQAGLNAAVVCSHSLPPCMCVPSPRRACAQCCAASPP